MHQTFYIDIDEEITSIIERLKKANSKEIVIVVPKRALLIQSIINLKLLKKEADKLKKELIIVTQDKLGKMLIEKTGIIVEQRLDGIEGEDISASETEGFKEEDKFSTENKFTAQKNELEELGTDEYLSTLPKKNRRQTVVKDNNEESVEKILNKELVAEFIPEVRGKFFSKQAVQSLDMVKNIDIKQKGPEEGGMPSISNKKNQRKEIFQKKDFLLEEEEVNILPNRQADDFFARGERARRKEEETYQNVQVGGKAWKIFFWFCFLILLASGAVGAYLFLPKTSITIVPKIESKSMDLEVKGSAGASVPDFSELIIPIKIVEIENEVTKTYEATGTKSDSNKKARGTITIYNEFSTSAQPLVATTRFLSESGKLFRLEKSISVPGTTQVGAEIKPGVIEATVVADEAGTSFNIEATKFSIPGFKGSGNDKFNKIYAKSSKAMQGGGDSDTSVKSVSATDLSSAKTNLAEELMESLKQKIKNENGDEYTVLDDAVNAGEIFYSTSAQEGTLGDDFSLTGKVKANVFIFKKTDFEELAVEKIISVSGVKKEQIKKGELKFEFGKTDTDFTLGTMLIRVSVKAQILPNFDLSKMKKDILGKNEEELKAYMSHFKEMESLNVDYWPSFLPGKIPQYEPRVELILDNN